MHNSRLSLRYCQFITRLLFSFSCFRYHWLGRNWQWYTWCFSCNKTNTNQINLSHATGLFRYPMKTSENQRFSVFKGCRKRPVEWNRLIRTAMTLIFPFLVNVHTLYLLKTTEKLRIFRKYKVKTLVRNELT